MRNGYIIDTLTSVDIQEYNKIGGKVTEFYEGVIYRKNLQYPLKKVFGKLFQLRQKYKDQNNDVMQLIVILIMNFLYGEQIRKDIEESYHCKSEIWILTEYDEKVLDYQKLKYGNYAVNLKDD